MSKPEERLRLPVSEMASKGLSGFVLDPAQCSHLSMEEKRELVREIAQWSKEAPEILSSFTRRELLEIICAEMGKERKYSGYTKLQMIEHLLKLVSQKPKRQNSDYIAAISPANSLTGSKRQRQKESQLKALTDLNLFPLENKKEEHVKVQVCQNAACRAALSPDDAFCRRCSCCICHYFDDNKDPSLWLTCGSDSPNKNSCGLTCHLICALKDERTGMVKPSSHKRLDGSFYCTSCGEINGLMRTWRKQLYVAKEARRVDVLCLRVVLAYRILIGTTRYKEIQRTMETALQMLKNEVGPLDLVCARMARGLVNRLSCGAEVQKLCASALEAFDFVSSDCSADCVEKTEPASCQICFEESSPTSVIVVLDYADDLFKDCLGCILWHRKAEMKDYPDKPTFLVLKPEKRFKITDLSPSTEYYCKASFLGNTGVLGVWEAKWSTPASEHRKQENAIIAHTDLQVNSSNPSIQSVKDMNKNRKKGFCSLPPSKESVLLMSFGSLSPSTPCKPTGKQEGSELGCKKRRGESDYEYSVRVVKWLEQEEHIDGDFRVKFLTWFSLKATTQERRVVNVFIDALIDDPPSLAGQLIHTFMDEICCEQKQVIQHGFCTRLWH